MREGYGIDCCQVCGEDDEGEKMIWDAKAQSVKEKTQRVYK